MEDPDEDFPPLGDNWGELRIEETEHSMTMRQPSNSDSFLAGADNDGSANELLSRIDDPDYLQFINSCLTSDPSLAVLSGTSTASINGNSTLYPI